MLLLLSWVLYGSFLLLARDTFAGDARARFFCSAACGGGGGSIQFSIYYYMEAKHCKRCTLSWHVDLEVRVQACLPMPVESADSLLN